MADRVAFMRQWPFFYDVTRQNKSWYSDEKVVCTLPPVGPAGKSGGTFAAGWGFGIPKTAKNAEAARELVKFFISREVAAKMVHYSTWFLNARHSVLNAAGDSGSARFLKMYTDAGIITTHPNIPKFMEALVIVENAISAFLSDQIEFAKALNLIDEQIGLL
jgi:ABC-type glycerol-3-phosphate transport system substrate-binding protein